MSRGEKTLRDQIKDVRTESKDVRSEVKDVRAGVKDVRTGLTGMRSEMHREFEQFSRILGQHDARLGNLEPGG